MSSAIGTPIVLFLYLLVAAIFARALISWFTIDPRNEFVRLLDRITSAILVPVRRVVPPIGFIDISAFRVLVVLMLMISVVRQATG